MRGYRAKNFGLRNPLILSFSPSGRRDAYREHRVRSVRHRLALRAAELCRIHTLSTADAIVYATALENGATLLTCDGHFEGLAGVAYVGKAEGKER